jgi:dUTP pyrophosphatase
MTWGLTFSAFNKMKIVHKPGRLHSNVDPVSRLPRNIPQYESPDHANDPVVELNPNQDLNFYEKYKRIATTMNLQTDEKLQVKKLSPESIIPSKATPDSIGYDLYSIEEVSIPTNSKALIGTGIAMTPPKGTYIRIAPRSGLAFKNMIQVGAGVIDPDYTGEIKVLLFNHGQETLEVKANTRIEQAIVESAKSSSVEVIDYLPPTKRGDKGFGSTGMEKVKIHSTTDSQKAVSTKTKQILKASAETPLFHTQIGRGEVDITYTSSYHMETYLHLDPQEIKDFIKDIKRTNTLQMS